MVRGGPAILAGQTGRAGRDRQVCGDSHTSKSRPPEPRRKNGWKATGRGRASGYPRSIARNLYRIYSGRQMWNCGSRNREKQCCRRFGASRAPRRKRTVTTDWKTEKQRKIRRPKGRKNKTGFPVQDSICVPKKPHKQLFGVDCGLKDSRPYQGNKRGCHVHEVRPRKCHRGPPQSTTVVSPGLPTLVPTKRHLAGGKNCCGEEAHEKVKKPVWPVIPA